MNKVVKILLSTVITISAYAAHADQPTARDLYYQPTKALFGSANSSSTIASNNQVGQNFTPQDNENLGAITSYYEKLDNPGVAYSIELLRKGSNSVKQVSSSYVFKSGDRIRIHVSSNGDGYMHVLHQGSTGNTKLIPVSTGGRVANGQNISIPSANGWLRFDSNKGIEKLNLVFASAVNASDLGILPTGQNAGSLLANIQQVAAKYSLSKSLLEFEQSGEKDLVLDGVSNVAPQLTAGVINRTSRPAVQVSSEIYNAPANYAVNTASEPVAININLKHQ